MTSRTVIIAQSLAGDRGRGRRSRRLIGSEDGSGGSEPVNLRRRLVPAETRSRPRRLYPPEPQFIMIAFGEDLDPIITILLLYAGYEQQETLTTLLKPSHTRDAHLLNLGYFPPPYPVFKYYLTLPNSSDLVVICLPIKTFLAPPTNRDTALPGQQVISTDTHYRYYCQVQNMIDKTL